MSRISFASQPFLLGFEQLDRLVERTMKAGTEGYPPYNIEQTGSLDHDGRDAYRITLAVAGFAEADLAITVEQQQLIVKGRQDDGGRDGAGDTPREFLHRGIAARPFQRSFVLAEGVEVEGAALENGLLHIDLIHRLPEVTVQEIKIGPDTNGSGK